MRLTAVFVVVLALAGSAFAASTSLVLVGTWKGTLHQRGMNPFKMKATIRGLARTARNTVHYTGINCSGRWTLTPKSPSTLGYVFRGGGVVSRGVITRQGQ